MTDPRTRLIFPDRAEAGRLLGEELARRDRVSAVVLGIPRGGVVVAAAAAEVLGLALDVVVPRKVRAPQNPELGLGAVAPGVSVLDEDLIALLQVPDSYLSQEVAFERAEVERRSELYRGGRPALDLSGRVAIIVDDGIATGGTAMAAIRWARKAGSDSVVLAVPVTPEATRRRLEGEADEVVVLLEPDSFYAVGQFYRDFDQVSDEEVVRLMKNERDRR